MWPLFILLRDVTGRNNSILTTPTSVLIIHYKTMKTTDINTETDSIASVVATPVKFALVV